MAGMTVELLDEQGAVIDTAVTNRSGDYRFDSMTATGLFQVRLAAGNGVDVVGSDVLSFRYVPISDLGAVGRWHWVSAR